MKCNGKCKYSYCMTVVAARGKEAGGALAADGAETKQNHRAE